jgi:hypothetical protein
VAAVKLLRVLQAGHIQMRMRPPASNMRKSVEGIAMPVVKFPGRPKRRHLAVAAFDPKRERMLLRAERVVELLGSRAIRDGWSFDKNRAARFLHCLRTFDRNVAGSPEVAEIVNWAKDHEQSLQWLAYHSPGKRQTRVLEMARPAVACRAEHHKSRTSLQFVKFASRLGCFKCGRMRISFSRRDRASEGLPLSLC